MPTKPFLLTLAKPLCAIKQKGMTILLSDNIEQKTLSEYLDKLCEINNVLDDIISKKIEIQNSEQKQSFKNIKNHLISIDYSTQYVIGEIAKKDKEEQLRISELSENIGLKYHLLYSSLLNEIAPEEKFELNRTLMGLNVYQSTFDRFLRFEDEKLLETINKK